MKRTMSAAEARDHFDEVVRLVVEEQSPIVVERDGKPAVIILSAADYERTCGEYVGRADWRASLARAKEQLRRDGAAPLDPPAEEVIRQMREERDEQLLANLR